MKHAMKTIDSMSQSSDRSVILVLRSMFICAFCAASTCVGSDLLMKNGKRQVCTTYCVLVLGHSSVLGILS
jgi:hypothetical protein